MTSQVTEATRPHFTPPDPIVNGESVIKYDKDADAVVMPYWYWEKLFDYIVDISTMGD